MQTIPFPDHLANTAKMYADISAAQLSGDLPRLSGSQLSRVLPYLPDSHLSSILPYLSGSQLSRALPYLSDDQMSSVVVPQLSDDHLSRVLPYLSDDQMSSVLPRLSGSNLSRVLPQLSDSQLAALNLPPVPVISDLDARMLEAIGSNGCNLDMGAWHSCTTTHCRAGWAVVLAGDAGKALEDRLGTPTAAAMIYEASTGRPAPDFYASDEVAYADIKRLASPQGAQ